MNKVLLVINTEGILIQIGHPSSFSARELKNYANEGYEFHTVSFEEYTLRDYKLYQPFDKNNTVMDDIISTGDKLYREANPGTKRSTPSIVYEAVEASLRRKVAAGSDLSLYDWYKKEHEEKRSAQGEKT